MVLRVAWFRKNSTESLAAEEKSYQLKFTHTTK